MQKHNMCYYNGMRVTRKDYLRLMALEKEVRKLRLFRPAQSGFDYRDWPIIKPTAEKNDFEIKEVHWEYIPETVFDEIQLQQMRENIILLNARADHLFVNEKGRISMFREGALRGRCLVLSTGFYEWRHIPRIGKNGKELKTTEAIPYHITLKEKPDEVFYMAGISREWSNEKRGQSADTFAIVTTEANELMERIHNTKKRMPVILTEELAKVWLYDNLSQDEISEIACYQYDPDKMMAWPVEKKFVEKTNPEEEFFYEHLPPL